MADNAAMGVDRTDAVTERAALPGCAPRHGRDVQPRATSARDPDKSSLLSRDSFGFWRAAAGGAW